MPHNVIKSREIAKSAIIISSRFPNKTFSFQFIYLTVVALFDSKVAANLQKLIITRN